MVAWFCSRSAAVRRGAGLEVSHLGVSQVVGVAGGGDVALDVGRLLGGLGGLHPELLHRGRVGGADDHRDERPQADGDHGQHPAPAQMLTRNRAQANRQMSISRLMAGSWALTSV